MENIGTENMRACILACKHEEHLRTQARDVCDLHRRIGFLGSRASHHAQCGYASRPRRSPARPLAASEGHGIFDLGVTFGVDLLALECVVVGARRITCEVNDVCGALRREARVGTRSAQRDGKSVCLTSSSIGWGDERE